MNVVLLSGGSGKRLWPLSNDMQSKQFLKLLKNPKGEYESMVQRVTRQLTAAHPEASVYVSCNLAQEDIVKKQLDKVETILEPGRRDTFPAIALAAAYLHYKKELHENDVFIVCPIDPYAEGLYFDLLGEVEKLVSSGTFKIGLLGALPTYPSEKYGYIQQDGGTVYGFIEKPPLTKAEELITQGALWNCGVFALTIGYVLNQTRNYVEFDSYETLHGLYERLPRISFDYEVVEKEKSIGAILYSGVWKDLGTWNTLTEELSNPAIGKHVLISENSTNTHILNMLDIPIIVQDISDAVIVASYDGILVSSKQGSSFLKPLTEQISLRPMYEQRSWGDYRILEYKPSDTGVSMVKRVRIEAGKSFNDTPNEQDRIWVIISGKGILTLNDIDSVAAPGDSIKIPNKTETALLAATHMEMIEVILCQRII
jgi:mannose-1-phosphate guanylyltransferase